MKDSGPIGWILILLFCVCCALRLARFNTNIGSPELPGCTKLFFSGVPAPAGAGLVLFPMIISFQTDLAYVREPPFVAIIILITSALLVSQLPTYSFKTLRVQHRFILPTMLSVGLVAALTVTAPWLTLTIIIIIYIASFPFSMRSYRKHGTKSTNRNNNKANCE